MKLTNTLVCYDIETYYDCFLFTAKHHSVEQTYVFELSCRRDDRVALFNYLKYLQSIDAIMVGYNSLAFDWPIIHNFMLNHVMWNQHTSYQLAQEIINGQQYGMPTQFIPPKDRLIKQLDLVKVWHYDNENKRTRLKDLEFAMRSHNIMDLPFDFRQPINAANIDKLIEYNIHDVRETEKFLNFSMERIELRNDLLTNGILKGDVLNWNDTKIGEQYFISKMNLQGRINGTDRLNVAFKDVILPQIAFRTEWGNDVLETFKSKHWVKGDEDHNKTISFDYTIGDLVFAFGSGGLHASVASKAFHSSDTHKIIDIDVASMYPSIGIVNGFHPEHLDKKFVDVYRQLRIDRLNYPKGSAMNAVLKLALNGVYGKSNSQYSPFFDIKYLFSITINGQLQLLQLVEMLLTIPDLKLIQCNTDGITAYVPRQYEFMFHAWKSEWEKLTGLELEEVEYKSMFIRDCNNYIAVDTKGKVKRKGCYWWSDDFKDYDQAAGVWHTDLSEKVVAKVAEATMLYGVNPEWYIRTLTNPYDFVIRQKIKGGQEGYIGKDKAQGTTRYFVSNYGSEFKIVRPPKGPVGTFKRKNGITDALYNTVLAQVGDKWDERIHTKNQSRYEATESTIKSGFKVTECCNMDDFNWENLNYDYYLEEVEKILI